MIRPNRRVAPAIESNLRRAYSTVAPVSEATPFQHLLAQLELALATNRQAPAKVADTRSN